MARVTSDQRPVVIVGGSGFVGTHLRRTVAGWPGGITLVSRRPLDLLAGERLVLGDVAAADRLASRLPAGAVIVNLAYDPKGGHDANLALADGLARMALDARSDRLVHVSTAMVAGLVGERPVTEESVCHPVTAYQQTKLDVEQRLRELLGDACRLVVLRPTAVFGPGGQNLRKIASDLATRPRYENYLRLSLFGRRPMNLVPVETVAAAVTFVATSDRADASLYLVADDEAPSNNFRDVERVIRTALGLPGYALPAVPVPEALLPVALKAAGRLSFDPRTTFSSARLQRSGFVRPVTFDAALTAYAAHAALSRGARA